MNRIYRVISLILLLAGIIFVINSEMDVTGAVVGAQEINFSVIGLLLIIASLMNYVIFSSKERKDYLRSLKDELEHPYPSKIKLFKTIEEGLYNTSEGELFRVKLSSRDKVGEYFIKVRTKGEAADIANYLVGHGSRPLRRLRGIKHKNLGQLKECTSTSIEALVETAEKYHLRATNTENVGFAKGERETKTGGRSFDRIARYDPPHKEKEQDILLSHYNVGGGDFRKGLHILVED